MGNGTANGNGAPKARLGVGCVRVSTDRQERSIGEQKDEIRSAAVKDSVAILEDLWCEDEGISGSILNRPGLSRLLALCRTRKDITDVYFWKRNRLTRSIDPLDGMNVEREIERHGKRVHFVQGIQKTGNKLIDSIASVLEYAEAGQYLVNLSTDTIRGLVPLTKQGFDAGRPTPYGYDRMVIDADGKEVYRVRNLGNGVRQKIEPDGRVKTYERGAKPTKDDDTHSTLVLGDPERVAVVKRLFDAFVREGKGLRWIIDEMNTKGISSPRGGMWTLGTVRTILMNPVYTGANVWNVRNFSKYHAIVRGSAVSIEPNEKSVRYNDRENWVVAEEGKGFPAIVSREVFEAAHAKRVRRDVPFSRGNALVVPYYLTGFLRCACGHPLHGHTKTGGKRKGRLKNFYYLCGGFSRMGNVACKRYLLPKEAIERCVFDLLAKRVRRLARVEAIREQIKMLLAEEGVPERDSEASLARKLADVEAKIRNWKTAISKGLDLDLAAEELKALAGEKERIEQDLALARNRKDTSFDVEKISQEMLSSLDRLEEVFREGAVAEAKAILRTYIGRIEYDPVANNARVGFFKVPGVLENPPGTSRVCILAGGGLDTELSNLVWMEIDLTRRYLVPLFHNLKLLAS